MVKLLDFVQRGGLDEIVEVVKLARDSIGLYINSLDISPPSTPDVSKLINHRLIKEEFERQGKDIEFLATMPEELDESCVSRLMNRAMHQTPILPIKGGHDPFSYSRERP
jgi:hypothetical protein